MKMNDIAVYKEVDKYESFQYLRPDYAEAILVSIDLAKKYTEELSEIVVSDFCCGTGSNTKKMSEKTHKVKKAFLIDINSQFLELAELSESNINELKIINKDILKADFEHESDLVLSIFAYHHIINDDKKKYVMKIKEALKDNGILILTEIYLPNKELCKKYYDKLISEIPENKHIPGLKEFLAQTAESNDFEFKVSKSFADTQFREAGFVKIEEVKIRPLDNSFEKDVGTFIQVYKYETK